MHRRSLSHFAELASASSAEARRHASTVVKRRPPKGHLPRKEYDRMELTTKGLVAAAARKGRKAQWGHPKEHEGETRRLTAAVKSNQDPAKVPSLDKQQFFSELDPETDEDFSALSSLEFYQKQRFVPGTMIELRRSDVVAKGVVLYTLVSCGRYVVYTLTGSGDVWPHSEGDVMFAIPSFVPEDLVVRCGVELVALNDHEIAARVQILKRVRNFELALERKLTELYHPLRSLYEQFRHHDRHEWSSITLNEATRTVDPHYEKVPILIKAVVHSYLFAKNRRFVADQTNYLSTEMFWVRPLQEIEDMETVEQMVIRNNPVVDRFVEKAKNLVESARAGVINTWQQPPSFGEDHSSRFTPEELTIIRFLRASVRAHRSTQRDPYVFPQSAILKKTGLYTGRLVEDDVVQDFLTELGAYPPWEDMITRQPLQVGDPSHTLDTAIDPIIKVAPPSSPSIQPLGQNDFYTFDIVDSLRHDFGDMPVYVIDDATAEELDDGISIERIPSEPGKAWLHVHIADPTVRLPPSHAFSRRAFHQVEAVYFLDRTVPLLPPVKAIAQLSLRQSDDPQYVLTFSAKVDEQGDIIDYKVRPGVVRKVHNLLYDDVNAALDLQARKPSYPFGGTALRSPDGSHLNETTVDDLTAIMKLTKALIANRWRRGMLQFSLPTVEMSLAPRPLPQVPPLGTRPYTWSGFPTVSYEVNDYRALESGSRQVVAECMRTACRVASLFFRDRGVPAIRRIVGNLTSQIEGGLDRLMASRDEDGFVDFFDAMNSGIIYAPAEYDIRPGPHAILGVLDGEGYVRVTSPLRRFGDMLSHWQIKHALLSPADPSPRMISDEWLLDYARTMGFKERKHKRFEGTQRIYWAHCFLDRWMKERQRGLTSGPDPLDSLVARIIDPLVKNARRQLFQHGVILPTLGLKADLVNLDEKGYAIGDSVEVKIHSIRLGIKPQLQVVRR